MANAPQKNTRRHKKTSEIRLRQSSCDRRRKTDRQKFFIIRETGKSLFENNHARLLDLFGKYLLVGGMPDAVNAWPADKNIVSVRAVQNEIHTYYGMDAADSR